jgi:hypothetical protein
MTLHLRGRGLDRFAGSTMFSGQIQVLRILGGPRAPAGPHPGLLAGGSFVVADLGSITRTMTTKSAPASSLPWRSPRSRRAAEQAPLPVGRNEHEGAVDGSAQNGHTGRCRRPIGLGDMSYYDGGASPLWPRRRQEPQTSAADWEHGSDPGREK